MARKKGGLGQAAPVEPQEDLLDTVFRAPKPEGKTDTPPPQQSTVEQCAERVGPTPQASGKDTPGKDRKFPQAPGGFVVVPDIPLGEL